MGRRARHSGASAQRPSLARARATAVCIGATAAATSVAASAAHAAQRSAVVASWPEDAARPGCGSEGEHARRQSAGAAAEPTRSGAGVCEGLPRPTAGPEAAPLEARGPSAKVEARPTGTEARPHASPGNGSP